MKKLYFLIIIVQSFFLIHWGGKEGLFAQSQFQVAIGGETGGNWAYSIKQTIDGGYAVAGTTCAFGVGGYNMYILKISSTGSFQWSKTVGGVNDDQANSIIQTTDAGYAVAGWSTSFGAGYRNMYIVKLSSTGSLQWSKTVGGTSDDIAYSIVQTTDGGYAVAGSTESFGVGNLNMYIIKLSSTGSLQWSKTVGGTDVDAAYSLIQTTDGGYAVAGYKTFPVYNSNMYIIKLSSTGSLQWSKTVGGTGDGANSIIQTTDGGYAVAGSTNSFGAGGMDMYIVKLDAAGSLQWSKTVGGTGEDYAKSIVQTTDGGYAAAGYTNSFPGGWNMYIVKLSTNGSLEWSKTVGEPGYNAANSIIQTTDGGYVVAGTFESDLYNICVVKLDANGNTCGNSTSPISSVGTGGTETSPTSTVTTPNSIVTTPVPTVSSGGTVTTICSNIGVQKISTEIPKSFSLYQNYPNPFNPSTKIKYNIPLSRMVDATGTRDGRGVLVTLKIYDILGREVATLVNEKQNPGSYEVTWDASNYPSGVYFYKLTAGNFTDTRRMALIK